MPHLSEEWNQVADLQAQAWAELQQRPNGYESKDVEDVLSWQLARKHADELMEKRDV